MLIPAHRLPGLRPICSQLHMCELDIIPCHVTVQSLRTSFSGHRSFLPLTTLMIAFALTQVHSFKDISGEDVQVANAPTVCSLPSPHPHLRTRGGKESWAVPFPCCPGPS